MDPRVQRLIVQAAVRHGVDPEVALRTALGEGGVGFGAVGDHGTSFGPFQLHIGGASPYSNPTQAASFANSPQGIDYAVSGIAKYARGLHGAQGVAAAVRGFERPANPSAEISRDLGYSIGAGSSNGRTLGSEPSDLGSSPSPAASLSPTLFGGSPQRAALAMSLFQQAANDFGGSFDPSGILALALSRRTAGAAQQVNGPTAKSGTRTAAAQGNYPVSPGGVKFIGDISGEYPRFLQSLGTAVKAVGGTAVRVNSGERSAQHNAAVGGASHSNHLPDAQGFAHAMDGEVFIPGRGWIPLGLALQGVAPKFGLRSGATFNWNGRPDVVHVDDAYNQRA